MNSRNLTSIIYSTFPYSSEQVMLFVDVFDAISTRTRATTYITITYQENLNIQESVTNIASIIESPTFNPSSTPLLISQIASLALNRVSASGDNPTAVTETMQNAYDMSMNVINSYVGTMNVYDAESITSVMSMLSSVTLNPNMNTKDNIERVSGVMDALLTSLNGTTSLDDSQVQSFIGICDNNFQVDSESVGNSSDVITIVENNIIKIQSNLLSGMVTGESKDFESGKVAIGVSSQSASDINNFTMTVGNSSMQLSEDIKSVLGDVSSVGISLTNYRPTGNDVNSSFSMISFNLINLANSESIEVNLSSYNRIVIPSLNLDTNHTYNCTYMEPETGEWSTEGCILDSHDDISITCLCNHLSIFSAFSSSALDTLTSSNIGDTVDVSAFSNLDLDNAIGIFFCGGIIICYIIFIMIGNKLDSNENERLSGLVVKLPAPSISMGDVTSRTDDSNIVSEDKLPHQEASNTSIDAEEESKNFGQYIVRNHEILSMFIRNKAYTRISRTTMFITMLLGNMFFIGLFYRPDQQDDRDDRSIEESFTSYTLRDFWVMVYSSLCMLLIGLNLKLLSRMIPTWGETDPKRLRRINCLNKLKQICFYTFSWGIMGWFT